MALKLGGKDERLRHTDFIALAALAGLRASDASSVIDDVLKRLPAALDAVACPSSFEVQEGAEATVARTLDLCRARIGTFG